MPIATLVGAGLGAATSAMDKREERKRRDADRPKRRKLHKFQQTMNEAFDRRQRAMFALAQSKLDFASQF